MRMPGSNGRNAAIIVSFGMAMLGAGTPGVARAGAAGGAQCTGAVGFYTESQAAHGKILFDDHCSMCHGAKLQGGAGPALSGEKFESSLEYSKLSAAQLFAFISSQMPYNDPGSLSETQYLAALSYIFKVNGYRGGSTELSKARLKCLALLPYPGRGKVGGG